MVDVTRLYRGLIWRHVGFCNALPRTAPQKHLTGLHQGDLIGLGRKASKDAPYGIAGVETIAQKLACSTLAPTRDPSRVCKVIWQLASRT